MQGRKVGLNDLQGLFQPKWFYDSVKICVSTNAVIGGHITLERQQKTLQLEYQIMQSHSSF